MSNYAAISARIQPFKYELLIVARAVCRTIRGDISEWNKDIVRNIEKSQEAYNDTENDVEDAFFGNSDDDYDIADSLANCVKNQRLKDITKAKYWIKNLHKASYKRLSKCASLYDRDYGIDERAYGTADLDEESLAYQYRDILYQLEEMACNDLNHYSIKQVASNKIKQATAMLSMDKVIIELSYTPQAIMTSIDDGGMERMFEQHGY